MNVVNHIWRLGARYVVRTRCRSYANGAGRRLNRKYLRMLYRGKRSQVAVTATGRELSGFLWAAMVGQVAYGATT